VKQQLNTNKGFTLIELLVVISIIGLLASIVLASLLEAKLKAENTKYKSSIKEVQKALALYYSEKNIFPDVAYTIQPSAALGDTWTLSYGAQELVSGRYMSLLPVAKAGGASFYYTATTASFSTNIYCGATKVQPNSYYITIRAANPSAPSLSAYYPAQGSGPTGSITYSTWVYCVTDGI
jgi:type II secretion system protein G